RNDVISTCGGTESNNLAIQGVLTQNPNSSRLLHSAIEHKAIIEVGAHLRKLGVSVETVPVDRYGRIVVGAARQMIESGSFDVNLVSVMHANNEIGTIQPIEEVSDIVASRSGILHVDAVQT